MEKGITIAARYHLDNGFYVDATKEDSPAMKVRDYWLCRKSNSQKLYMFSEFYHNAEMEKKAIRKHVDQHMQRYLQTAVI